jgi:hypothetical protein
VSLNNEKFVVKLVKINSSLGENVWSHGAGTLGLELSVLESVSSRKNISDPRHAK